MLIFQRKPGSALVCRTGGGGWRLTGLESRAACSERRPRVFSQIDTQITQWLHSHIPAIVVVQSIEHN